MNHESLSKRFAQRILKSPQDAILIAVLLAASGFLSWLATVVICLVTLKHGPKKSWVMLLWASLPLFAVGAYNGELILAFKTFGVSFVFPWFLSVVLYRYGQWQTVIAAAVSVCVIGLLIMAIVVPDYTSLMIHALKEAYQTLNDGGVVEVPTADMQHYLNAVGGFLPGVIVAVNALQALIKLMLARGLQASLENPGGLKQELLALRGQLSFLILSIGCLLLKLFGLNLGGQLALVFLLPALLSGFSVVHWFANDKKLNLNLWTVPAYIVIILFIPYSLLGLVIVSLVDTFFDFRKQPKLKAKLL